MAGVPANAPLSRSLLPHVGRTPLIELRPELLLPRGVRLLAKLESVNPGGSLKDRPVSRILRRAVTEGKLAGGRRLLDSSSGNAGSRGATTLNATVMSDSAGAVATSLACCARRARAVLPHAPRQTSSTWTC